MLFGGRMGDKQQKGIALPKLEMTLMTLRRLILKFFSRQNKRTFYNELSFVIGQG